MRETKLYSALVRLDGFELNRLHRFILSPYFNRNEATINLFEWVKDDLKKPAAHQISKEELWHICFGKSEPFNDGRFRKLQSDLLKLIEEFYTYEAFEANPLHKAKFLIESVLDNDLEALQSGAFKSAQSIIKDINYRSSTYYYAQYDFESNMYRFQQKNSERGLKSNIENITINLDRFYLGEKLKYYCSVLSHKLLTDLEYELLFMNEIIEHIKSHDYSDVPSITIYYQILLMYSEPDNKSHFENLQTIIDENIHHFPNNEAKEILDSALNYGLDRLNSGEKEYVRKTFDLYMKSLDNGVLLVKNFISPWSFKNIVTLGLRLNEFDIIEKFIYEYSEKLEERFRDNALTFNLAQLYFYKKEYSKVISQLSMVEYDDMTYILNSKTLLMASYYELEEIEALNSFLDTFRIYLNRNKKVPSYRRKHYLTTIGIVKKLLRIKLGDTKSVEKLTKEIRTTHGIVSQNWILEKLAALRGK